MSNTSAISVVTSEYPILVTIHCTDQETWTFAAIDTVVALRRAAHVIKHVPLDVVDISIVDTRQTN